MKTEYIAVDPQSPDPEAVGKAGRIIREGGLCAFPTETVYGLGGDALSRDAAKKIYAAKGRPSDNPLIVHIADRSDLAYIVSEVPESAEILMDRFWPGPLTLIFRKRDTVPYATTGGLDTVAVRFPSHPAAQALIRAAGGYVAAPSANASGRPSTTKASHVLEDLDGRIEMILDGGEVPIGLESTIVDVTEEIPVILRPGYISQKMLEDAVGCVRVDPAVVREAGAVRPKAPGMRYRHYAPKAPLTIVEGDADAVAEKIRSLLEEAEREGKRAAVLCCRENENCYAAERKVAIAASGDEEEIAHRLFDCLRSFDEEAPDIIYSESFYTPQLGDAIMNRLMKAAGHRVIRV